MNRLADQVTGPVLAPRDKGYDAERAGWQTARRHRPDLLVGAAGPADVQAAVRYASDRGLPVAVQGTGHASAAVAAEGGVLITTARMNGVRVDADAGTAWVAAGTRWDRVVHRAAPAGLAPLSGSAPHVGAVSYTLGGGLALLSRSFGYAADHVRGLEAVTADGRLRRVTRDHEPDLFWALRGGRDNFGVVTAMEIDLMPVTTLYGGALVFPVEKAADVCGQDAHQCRPGAADSGRGRDFPLTHTDHPIAIVTGHECKRCARYLPDRPHRWCGIALFLRRFLQHVLGLCASCMGMRDLAVRPDHSVFCWCARGKGLGGRRTCRMMARRWRVGSWGSTCATDERNADSHCVRRRT